LVVHNGTRDAHQSKKSTMSVRPDTANDATEDGESAMHVSIRQCASAVITAKGDDGIGLTELISTVLASLVSDLPEEEAKTLKQLTPSICEDAMISAQTACMPDAVDIDEGRVSLKLSAADGDKLSTACEAAETLPVIPSVVEEVMSAAEAVVAEKADAAGGEPLVDKAAVIEAPATDAAIEGSGATDPVDDAAVVTTGSAAVKPSDSVSQAASEASTVIEKVETLLDAVVLSHNALNERLDAFGKILLKTSGTPMSDKTSRETILYLQDIYNPARETDKINMTATHTGVDLAALVANARARHGL
jgi:hypothetical protein